MALATYFQRGEALDYTNSGSTTIDANTIVLLGARLGVVGCDIAPGATGSLHVEGVYAIPKASGAITAGALVYWDSTNSVVTTTSSSNTLCGYAIAAAASGDATALVKINA